MCCFARQEYNTTQVPGAKPYSLLPLVTLALFRSFHDAPLPHPTHLPQVLELLPRVRDVVRPRAVDPIGHLHRGPELLIAS